MLWLLLLVHRFFSDGGQSIVQPSSAKMWPTRLRVSGMGLAYGAGNLGRVAGLFALGLIAGSTNLVKPQAGEPGIEPALLFVADLLLACGLIFVCFGFETNGRSLEQIDRALGARLPSDPVPRAAEAPLPVLLGSP